LEPHVYRPLDDTLVAAQSSCKEISGKDIEVVLARGRVAMTGTRSDKPGDVPDRIETLISTSIEHTFSFETNSISVRYPTWEEKGLFIWISDLFPSPPITFKDVRVSWSQLINALHEAGFNLSIHEKFYSSTRRSVHEFDLPQKEREFVAWMTEKKEAHDRYPPKYLNDRRHDLGYWSNWADTNEVPLKIVEEWVKEHGLKNQQGRPKADSD